MAEWRWQKRFLIILSSLGFLFRADGQFVNVAVNGVATQVTTVDDQEAQLALDDDPATCSKTNRERGAWWKVDLGSERIITTIDLVSSSSLENLKITVSSSPDDEGNVCFYYDPKTSKEDTIQCYRPMLGRYVTITVSFRKSLMLCSVRVNECEDEYFGNSCKNQCHCVDNDPCDKSTGSCPIACSAGYVGDDCQEECSRGKFGLQCQKNCHCAYGVACEPRDGRCPVECAQNWLGNDCQTEFPRLLSPPVSSQNQIQATAIELSWYRWNGHIDARYQLVFHVLYRQYRGSKNKSDRWLELSPLVQTSDPTQTTTIGGLEYNTRYEFKLIPYMLDGTEEIKGKPSPISQPIKTKCTAPEAPKIQEDDIFSSLDDGSSEQKAKLTVRWGGVVGKKALHCDSLLYYEVMFQKEGSHEWLIRKSKDEEYNITGLDFDTAYRVKVAAINNELLRAGSGVQNVKTHSFVAVAEKDNVKIGLIAAIFILIILIVIVIIGIIFYRRRQANYAAVPVRELEDGQNNIVKNGLERDTTPTEDSGVVEGSSDVTPVNDVMTDSMSAPNDALSDGKAATLPPLDKPVEPRPIKVEELEDYVMLRRDKECEDLRNEYKEIPEGFNAQHEIGKQPGNKHKNRFINIIAYDHSRVILDQIPEDDDSHYINANYIELEEYGAKLKYIASQGCNKFTIQDMWRMVWQVRGHRIVMVTNLVENGKRKCEQYWPELDEKEEKPYGDVCVKMLDIEQTSDFVIRTFQISKGEESRNVKQFHFTAWPDHGLPTRAGPIMTFRRKVRSYDESHPGPLVVHCSAGVGRTGTFIALDVLMEQAKDTGYVDIYGIVQKMRKNRVNMIQTVEQYIFVYEALLEALKAGNTAIPCSDFEMTYAELCKVDPEKGKSKLQEQYETLQCMSPKVKPEDCKSGALAENEEKNRDAEVLPADRHRPYLMTRVQGTNDYINAVFLDGYKSRNAYIVTQMPLPHTVIDFWRMVYEHNCGSIVMLNLQDVDESYAQYWLDEETCECGPFIIEPVSTETPNPDITVRELKLTYQPQSPSLLGQRKEDKMRKVNQFQLNSWPPNVTVPASKTALISLIDLVDRSQFKTGNGPVLIHCHDGAQQSGLYAAVSCIWEQMKLEQEVDIFHTVKHLRYHRPQVIQNMEQYEYCYDMVLAYQAEFQTYANFR